MIRYFLLLSLVLTTSLTAEPKRILVGSPVYQKPEILKEFLASLLRQEREGYSFDYFFVDDNKKEEPSQMLRDFAPPKGEQVFIEPGELNSPEYVCTEYTHSWNEALIWKVARFKDRMIAFAREHGYDYLFLIDSDLVLHPKTVDQLLSAQKEIVSNIFWTSWQPGSMEHPQVWMKDSWVQYEVEMNENLTEEEISDRRLAFFRKLRVPGVYEVGGLGACTLISKSALQKGVSYERIKNVNLWGEDCHFCIRAVAMGIDLFVDTHYPAYHIFRESELEGVAAFIAP